MVGLDEQVVSAIDERGYGPVHQDRDVASFRIDVDNLTVVTGCYAVLWVP